MTPLVERAIEMRYSVVHPSEWCVSPDVWDRLAEDVEIMGYRLSDHRGNFLLGIPITKQADLPPNSMILA